MSFVDVCQHRKQNALEVIFDTNSDLIVFVLQLYEKSFESPLLQATGEYYREEGNRSLTKVDCIQYMKKVI